MARLNAAELRDLGLDAALQVVGAGFDEVEISPGVDSSNRPAYFVSYRFVDRQDRAKASLLKTRLSQRLRDELVRRGDPRYPFVRLLAAEDWGRRGFAGPD